VCLVARDVAERVADRAGVRQRGALRQVQRTRTGDRNAPGVDRLQPGEDPQRRRLAGAGRPAQRHQLAAAHRQPGQDQRVATGLRMPHPHSGGVDARNAAGRARRRVRRTGQGLVHVGDHRARVRPRVVARGHLAQRPVHLRRQQDHQQRRGEAEVAGGHPQSHLDRDQADRQRADQVQRGRGQERDAQHPQGGGAVPVGHIGHHGGLAFGPPVHAEGGEAAHHVEEVARQARVGGPAFAGPRLGGPADQRAQQRDQRQAEQRDQCRRRVDDGHRDQHERW
jgi:hypothetical protein